MSETKWMPPPAKDIHAAKRQFVELYGSHAVMNTYLKISVLALCAVCVGLIVLHIKTRPYHDRIRPWVIRINEVGRAEAATDDSLVYRPREAELKYFLIQFVHQHYARMPATVRDNYPRSLYFLDGPLAEAIIEANRKAKVIEDFLAGQRDEIDVEVKNVVIEDLRQLPYKASVEFEKVYYAANHNEVRRERYVATIVFMIKDSVPNALIPVNPLGFSITYFRADQAFK